MMNGSMLEWSMVDCMDGWMDGWMDGKTGGLVIELLNGCKDEIYGFQKDGFSLNGCINMYK